MPRKALSVRKLPSRARGQVGVQTGQVREIDGREQSDGVDDVGGPVHGAGVGGDLPQALVVQVDRGPDLGAEAEVAAQVETVDDTLEVLQDLGLGDVRVLPRAVLQQILVERKAVDVALRVGEGARVAVPVPRAAGTVRLVETHCGETEFVVQLVDGIDAAETSADDNGVDDVGSGLCRHGELLCRSDAEEEEAVKAKGRGWTTRTPDRRGGGSRVGQPGACTAPGLLLAVPGGELVELLGHEGGATGQERVDVLLALADGQGDIHTGRRGALL